MSSIRDKDLEKNIKDSKSFQKNSIKHFIIMNRYIISHTLKVILKGQD